MRAIWNWFASKATLWLILTVLLSNYNQYVSRRLIAFLIEVGELDKEIIGLQHVLIERYKAELNKE